MLIDWFTIIAQAINFLILVSLMKRFLYKPVLNAIDARETKIASQLADAEKKKNDAEKAHNELKQKNDEFDAHREMILDQAVKEAASERGRLLDTARKESAALRLKRHETLKNEEQQLLHEIIRRTEQEVFSLSRKVLMDLVGTGLEERMVEAFLHKLQELNSEEVKQLCLTQKSKSGAAAVTVQTMFDLSAPLRDSTEGAIKKLLDSSELQIKFEIAPELISGIELIANGHKVAWSISCYLKSMEKTIDSILQDNYSAEDKIEPVGEEPALKNAAN